jgi:hypothetical protein
MLWLRGVFILLNVIYCLMAVAWSTNAQFNQFGKFASSSIWIWQLIGVALVVAHGFSAGIYFGGLLLDTC